MIDYLQFDSNLFGYNVGILYLDENHLIEIDQILNLVNLENFKLIYLKSNFKLENSNYIKLYYLSSFHEEKLTFSKKVQSQKLTVRLEENEEIQFLDLKIDNLKIVKNLAYQSGIFSRFRLDENFNNQEFTDLYDTWIENIFKTRNENALVYKSQNKISGFLSWQQNGSTVKVGLIAVDHVYRNKGIGRKLLFKLESIVPFGTNIIINTQNRNTLAINFYSKLGYEIVEKEYIYHIWK